MYGMVYYSSSYSRYCEDDILTVSQSEESTGEESQKLQDKIGTAPSTSDQDAEKKAPPQCLICMVNYFMLRCYILH